jgi:hypothetical protein
MQKPLHGTYKSAYVVNLPEVELTSENQKQRTDFPTSRSHLLMQKPLHGTYKSAYVVNYQK